MNGIVRIHNIPNLGHLFVSVMFYAIYLDLLE